MNKHLLYIAIGLSLLSLPVSAVEKADAINPQTNMVGARVMSLGGINPSLPGDVNSVMVNPAVLGEIDMFQLGLTNQNLFGIPYTTINSAIPWGDITLGLSFGTNVVGGIPETVKSNGVIRDIGAFSAGMYVLHGSVGKTYYDFFFTEKVSIGIGTKIYNQVIKDKSRYAYGLDAGALVSYNFYNNWFNRLYFSGAVLNLLATDLKWPDGTGQTESFARQFLLGSRVDMMDERLSLFAQTEFAIGKSTEFKQLSFATEYELSPEFYLRGGTTYFTESSDFSFNLGTGLILQNIIGLNYSDYNFHINYNITLHPAPMENEPTHTFSLYIAGESRLFKPRIVSPKVSHMVTDQNIISLKGEGPKNTQILIYNNQLERGTVRSDQYGNWEIKDLRLKEGKNRILAKSFSVESRESLESNELTIVVDTHAPKIKHSIDLENGNLTLKVTTSERLKSVTAAVGSQNIPLHRQSDNLLVGSIPLPKRLQNNGFITRGKSNLVTITASDKAANNAKQISDIVAYSITSPFDQTITTNSTLDVVGQIGKTINFAQVNGTSVTPDYRRRFDTSQSIPYGKSVVTLTLIDNRNIKRRYFARILRPYQYDDLSSAVKSKQQIEYLATSGVMTSSDTTRFYPTKPVTKLEYVTILNEVFKPTLSTATQSSFEDIDAIDPNLALYEYAVHQGWTDVESTGRFESSKILNYRNVVQWLGSINAIPKRAVSDQDNRPLSRLDLARLILETKAGKARVSTLLNWDIGYKSN